MSEQAAEQPGTAGDYVVHAVLRTDVGLVRSENQDFGTLSTAEEEAESPGRGRLFVVADGMGGHRGGATASRLAAQTLKAQFLGSEGEDIPTALREALTRANARVYSEAQSNPDLRGMGTTTSALAVRGREAWFAHVGDSRIYLVRGERITQLTDDHSLVASMMREGLLTREEAENHPRRNVLQRSVGVGEQVEIDVRGPVEIEPGDTFILCSDGLHGLVKEPELKDIAKLGIEDAADVFVQKALERGAPDNVTVIVARYDTPESFNAPRMLRQTTEADSTVELAAYHDPAPEAPGSAGEERDESKIPTVPVRVQTEDADAAPAAAPRRPLKRLLAVLGVVTFGAAGYWLYWWLLWSK